MYAIRHLRGAPAFAAAAIITLGLGIGVTTAIFTVASTLLLRPLPFNNAERLVRIVETLPPDQGARRTPLALEPDEFADLQAHAHVLAYVGTLVGNTSIVTGRAESIPLTVTRMSAAFFPMLGERPMLGRSFEASEETSAPSVIVLGHAAWQRWFGGSANVIGQSIQMDGRPVTIVGVMPASFAFPDAQTDAWQPFRPARTPGRVQRFVVYAALREDVSLQTASVQVSALLQELRGLPGPNEYREAGEALPFELVPLKDELIEPVRPALRVLVAAASIVLLLACVNVATLLLARGTSRRAEVATRLAIGATRARIVRQLLTESLVLAGLGGVAGEATAAACIAVLKSVGTSLMRRDLGQGVSLPRLDEVHIDFSVFATAMALALLSAVIAGVWPAVRLGALRPSRANDRPETRGTRQLATLGPLVVIQVALAVTLLIGSTLLIRSFSNLMRVNIGFEAANVLTFRVSFPAGRYSQQSLETFTSRVVDEISVQPGVVSASYTHFLPLVQTRSGTRVSARPRPLDPDGEPRRPAEWPNKMWVHQKFFDTLRARISEGRGFADSDDAMAPGVAIVNKALVRSGLVGSSPIGQIVYFGTSPKPWEIVGVVDDFVQFSLGIPAAPEIYTDVRQDPALPGPPSLGPYMVVRTAGLPLRLLPSVRAALSRVDGEAAVVSIATMDEIIGNARSRPRLHASLMSVFAAAALIIAACGIFGVISYVVALSRREIGIRLSLGATPSRVVRAFVMQASVRTATGLLIGLTAATALSQYLESMLFGVSETDAWSFAVASALLAITMIVAAFVPASRAASVNPIEVLRAE